VGRSTEVNRLGADSALFPLLLFFTALIGLFPVNAPTSGILDYARQVISPEALGLVECYLDNVVHGSGTDVFSLGIIGVLWAASSGMTARMPYALVRA